MTDQADRFSLFPGIARDYKSNRSTHGIYFLPVYVHTFIHTFRNREPSSAGFYERLQTAWYCSFPSLFRAFLHPLCSLLASVRSSRFLSGFTTTWRMLIRLISCEKCNSRTTSRRLFMCSRCWKGYVIISIAKIFFRLVLIHLFNLSSSLVLSCCWILMETIIFFVSFLSFSFFIMFHCC